MNTTTKRGKVLAGFTPFLEIGAQGMRVVLNFHEVRRVGQPNHGWPLRFNYLYCNMKKRQQTYLGKFKQRQLTASSTQSRTDSTNAKSTLSSTSVSPTQTEPTSPKTTPSVGILHYFNKIVLIWLSIYINHLDQVSEVVQAVSLAELLIISIKDNFSLVQEYPTQQLVEFIFENKIAFEQVYCNLN